MLCIDKMIRLIILVILAFAVSSTSASFIGLPRLHHSSLEQNKFYHPQSFIHHNYPSTSSRRSRTCLQSSSSDSISAGSTLILSTISGMLFEKSNGGGGHVITLLMSALISNTSQLLSGGRLLSIPTSHYLYDWCWSIFLPASLVFALLSSPTSTTSLSTYDAERASITYNSKSKALKSMALPFIVGSIGSILGCVTSFHYVSMPYPKQICALLAGCLCASYIGGTVNFFATAKALQSNDINLGSAFGSMAAADLVVMALYFGMLQTLSGSRWLHHLFSKVRQDEYEQDKGTKKDELLHHDSSDANINSTTKSSRKHYFQSIMSMVISSSIALTSVTIATCLERKVISFIGVPGTLCAFLAILGLFFQHLIGHTIRACKEWKPGAKPLKSFEHLSRSLQGISTHSPWLSNICFYLLFAAVGTTANLSSAVAGGPAALVFASLALIVHSITALGGTLIGMRFIRLLSKHMKLARRWPLSSFEEVLTASNAAIGGPSTAAVFAADLLSSSDKDDDDIMNARRNQYRSSLIVSATFWGVIGYAVATSE